MCLHIQTEVEQRIGRALTRDEELGIWNAGSLTMLESVDRELMHTSLATDLPNVLQHNVAIFQERFVSALAEAAKLIAQHKLRALLGRHQQQVAKAQTVYDIMKVTEQYPDAMKRPK
jgi:hypothetical protein